MEKGFTITYEYGDNLYVNPTNRCDFNCDFCLRHNQSSGGSIYTHNLWLKREPSREELLSSIESHDLSKYRQLVFVGFGEPTYRFDDICWVIDRMKEKGEQIFTRMDTNGTGSLRMKEKGEQIFTRMDTNGTGSLINGRDITPEFAGRFDMVSVSLNTDTAEKYEALCHPQFPGAYEAMLDFTRRVRQFVPHVMMTVVDTISPEEIEACRKRRTWGPSTGCGPTSRIEPVFPGKARPSRGRRKERIFVYVSTVRDPDHGRPGGLDRRKGDEHRRRIAAQHRGGHRGLLCGQLCFRTAGLLRLRLFRQPPGERGGSMPLHLAGAPTLPVILRKKETPSGVSFFSRFLIKAFSSVRSARRRGR